MCSDVRAPGSGLGNTVLDHRQRPSEDLCITFHLRIQTLLCFQRRLFLCGNVQKSFNQNFIQRGNYSILN